MKDEDVDGAILEEEIEVLDKEINQAAKIEPTVKALSSMGTIWKKITTKFVEDNICYMCKRYLEKKEHFDIIVVPHKKVDKGLLAFVCVCKMCNVD